MHFCQKLEEVLLPLFLFLFFLKNLLHLLPVYLVHLCLIYLAFFLNLKEYVDLFIFIFLATIIVSKPALGSIYTVENKRKSKP